MEELVKERKAEEFISQCCESREARVSIAKGIKKEHVKEIIVLGKLAKSTRVQFSNQTFILNVLGEINQTFQRRFGRNTNLKHLNNRWKTDEFITYLIYHISFSEFKIKLQSGRYLIDLPYQDKFEELGLKYNYEFIQNISYREMELEDIYKWYILGDEKYKDKALRRYEQKAISQLKRYEWSDLLLGDDDDSIKTLAKEALQEVLTRISKEIDDSIYIYEALVSTYIGTYMILNKVEKWLEKRVSRKSKDKKRKEITEGISDEVRDDRKRKKDKVKFVDLSDAEHLSEEESDYNHEQMGEIVEKLKEAIDKCLDQEDKDLFKMRTYDGLSFKEIKEILNQKNGKKLEANSYQVRFKRIPGKLKKCLGVKNNAAKDSADEDYIDEILTKYLTNTASEEEEDEIDDKLENDEDFQDYFIQVESYFQAGYRLWFNAVEDRAIHYKRYHKEFKRAEREEFEQALELNPYLKERFEAYVKSHEDLSLLSETFNADVGRNVQTNEKEFGLSNTLINPGVIRFKLKVVLDGNIVKSSLINLYQYLSSLFSDNYQIDIIIPGNTAGFLNAPSREIEIELPSKEMKIFSKALSEWNSIHQIGNLLIVKESAEEVLVKHGESPDSISKKLEN